MRGFTPQLFTAQIQSMQFAFSYPRPSIPIFSERQELADSQNYNEFLLPYYCSVPLATTIGSIDFLLCFLPKTDGIEGTNRGLIVQWVFDPGSAMESPYGLRKFAKNEQLTGYRTTYFANTQSKSVWQIYIASFAYLLHVVDMRTMGNILGISMPLSPTISYLTWTVNGFSRLLLCDKDYKFESSDVKFLPLICNAIQKYRQQVEGAVAAQKFKMRIPRDCRGGTRIARHNCTKGSIFMVVSDYCPRASMIFSCHGLWELIANMSLMNIFGGLVWTSTTFVLAMNIEHVFNKKDVHNSLCVVEYLFHLSLVEFYHSDIGLIFLLVYTCWMICLGA
ncbi:uncharacterized protein LOC114753388 [Neltuma alba]|uniref:uncharacterized protein LOC114753388 n=1 Tax=Neltuma alba TaxID=207710 RepID=UPI0010A2B5E6|nr:uncharacterized protein LOC114753388 [Prosopis alba]